MIKLHKIQRHLNLTFEQYIKLPGYSYSFLRRERDGVAEDMDETAGMILGKLVDAILTRGHVEYTHSLYPYARQIAQEIRDRFGAFINILCCQVSYTAIAEYNGFFLPVKGRPDYEVENRVTIDLKVTKSKDVHALINYMQYDRQLYGYGAMGQTKDHYIMIYSIPLKKCFLLKRDTEPCGEWWADKVILHGSVNVPI